MKLPVVAIVGRPNVGKSSLLNCLAGRRVSIVEETPGVTRDRVTAVVSQGDVTMELVDTGGIGVVDRDDLSGHVERQIDYAVRGADAIVFVVDVRDGVMPLDVEVAKRLRERERKVPVFLAVNKADGPRLDEQVGEFFKLGIGEPFPISAKEHLGTEVLLELLADKLWPTGEGRPDPVLKIAVVGRQNVGKSSLVNSIAQEERVIVSEVPGTTRDAVDVQFQKDGREFVIIDTAGVKRKRAGNDSIEFYSRVRTEIAIRRADVVLFVVDASQPISRADKKLGELIVTMSRVCVVVANKWDLVKDAMSTEEYAEYIYKVFSGLRFAPIVATTATQGRNLQSAIDLAQHLYKRASRRVGTGELNRVIDAIKEYHPPKILRSKRPKIFYATQVDICPPTFVIFVNEPALFAPDYRRYVENAFRESLDFAELPLRIFYRARSRNEPGQRSGPSTGTRIRSGRTEDHGVYLPRRRGRAEKQVGKESGRRTP